MASVVSPPRVSSSDLGSLRLESVGSLDDRIDVLRASLLEGKASLGPLDLPSGASSFAHASVVDLRAGAPTLYECKSIEACHSDAGKHALILASPEPRAVFFAGLSKPEKLALCLQTMKGLFSFHLNSPVYRAWIKQTEDLSKELPFSSQLCCHQALEYALFLCGVLDKKSIFSLYGDLSSKPSLLASVQKGDQTAYAQLHNFVNTCLSESFGFSALSEPSRSTPQDGFVFVRGVDGLGKPITRDFAFSWGGRVWVCDEKANTVCDFSYEGFIARTREQFPEASIHWGGNPGWMRG
jgi:hypothetical protein